jgi:hypothetical protein
MMIAIASYSRSHNRCKFQKLLTVYFKSCGLRAKAFDMLNALGITMSQKWAYVGIKTLSQVAHDALLKDIRDYPWFGVHDNINLVFKVCEQCLNNKSHFDSGMAGTIIVLKDPACVTPDAQSYRHQSAAGTQNPITYMDILKLEVKAAPRLKMLAVYHILQCLTSAAQFNFETYKYKDHEMFNCPSSLPQLPVGPQYATCQYMLNTLPIEEASYEGNERVLGEWLKQLDLDSPAVQKTLGERQILAWAGNQMMIARICGLKRFHCEDLNSFDHMEHLREVFGWFYA